MNWGDTLCGVMLPDPMHGDYDQWDGGINEYEGGVWARQDEYQPGLPVRPIFPPRGWAGKTDAELWAECWHIGEQAHTIGTIPTRKGCIEVSLSLNGNIGIEVTDGFTTIYTHTVDRGAPAALILALQNAQVLAARLNEVKP